MNDWSEWLDSCFDTDDERAPIRAFFFGAVLASIAAVIASVAFDPTNWRLLLALVTGAIILGGGCSAMFALPPEKFLRMCSLGFDVWWLLPLKLLLGAGLILSLLIAFSFFVGILACMAAAATLFSMTSVCGRWLLGGANLLTANGRSARAHHPEGKRMVTYTKSEELPISTFTACTFAAATLLLVAAAITFVHAPHGVLDEALGWSGIGLMVVSVAVGIWQYISYR